MYAAASLKMCCTVLLLQAASHGVRRRQCSMVPDRTLAQRPQGKKHNSPTRGGLAMPGPGSVRGGVRAIRQALPARRATGGLGEVHTQRNRRRQGRNIVIGRLLAASSILWRAAQEPPLITWPRRAPCTHTVLCVRPCKSPEEHPPEGFQQCADSTKNTQQAHG